MVTAAIDKKRSTIATFLTSEVSQKQLQMALPKVGITKERMVRLMFSVLNNKPELFECTKETLLNAMIQCATLGLEPGTQLGHAYLLPFKNHKKNIIEVQLIIGYKGYLSLARRSGELSSISSHVVREGDEFEYQFGTEEFLKHKPKWHDLENRKTIFAYSVAKFKDGSTSFEIMSVEQIELIRARSKSPEKGPWVTDYEPMCRKTVIRRHMNYLPLSIEIARAVAIDGQNEAGIQDMGEIIDIDIAKPTEKDNGGNDKKKSPLEEMAEADEKKPTLKTPKEELEERLNVYFNGDIDARDKWLFDKTDGKRTVDSLTDAQVKGVMGLLVGEMGS